ncbi:MAG: CBS domain-containing protein [Planctomycetota bacterium]|nr:MAG: CBS domain-containing protein [Planctomycetota bacterium]
MQAQDLMVTDLATIRSDESLVEATARMMERKLATGHEDVRCLVVVDESERPVHVLTEADLIRAILPGVFRDPNFVDYISRWLASDLPQASLNEMFFDMARAARRKTVGDLVLDKPLVSVTPDASIVKIAYLMHQERIKTLPVVENGVLVGMVFRAAVFDVIAREILRNREVSGGGSLPPPNAD